MELCRQAAVEPDSEKLMELVTGILSLLEAKERELVILPPRPDFKQP